MAADRLALATRTMKARRYSTCSVCQRLIIRGDQIARLVRPDGWCHIACVPAVARALRDGQ
jgi:hypothetical protein